MNQGSRFWITLLAPIGLLLAVAVHPPPSRSQALEAQIDGVVMDLNGSVIPSASITAVNVQTGAKQNVSASENGIFRFPILSLGAYTIIVESKGFKRFERRGIMLSAGQTASIPILLEPGDANEIVTVTSDTAIADASKFEIGHLVNSRDVQGLPLVSRNPYNFILLQPGVNGRTVSDPFPVDLSAGGLHRRAGYLIDGAYNNESNSAGFRLNLISETFVKEMHVLTRGYSAEFGNTAGAVVNVITPAGTNEFKGSSTFLLRPAGLSSKPFGFEAGTASNISSYGVTAALGGPILRDRWHFYAGYEWTRRNSVTPITIAEEDRAALIAAGLPGSNFVNDKATSDTLPYFLFRTDAKASANTRVSFRYNRFDSDLRNSVVGGIFTTERSTSQTGYTHAIAVQAVTSFSETFFNEFRFQHAQAHILVVPGATSASGVSVSIPGIANFGPNPRIGVWGPKESTLQFQDAVTKVFDPHSLKFGGGIILIRDRPKSEVSATYRFSSIEDYASAANGTDPQKYMQYSETFGDSEIPYRSTFLNFFVQDDWRISHRFRAAIGLRYELYRPPAADPGSPLPYSRSFNLDANNFAPRLGLVYLLRDGKYRTVIRVGSGLHHDPPPLSMYRRAILNNGNPRYFSFTFPGGSFGAPDFPNRLGTFPSGVPIPPRNIDAVAPDFETMYAIHSNVQVEQEITDDISLTAGYLHTAVRHIPVYRNINCRPVGGTLADGRPLYGTILVNASGGVSITSCSDPIVPQFNVIKMVESAGNLNYHAFFMQLVKRFSHGFQATANFTLSRARDDAPEENVPGPVALSDPSNRAFDRGNAYGDIASVFSFSLVARPTFSVPNRLLKTVLNNNQLGLIVLADSGENFDISTGDLNRDGVLGSDRPVGIPRNAGRLAGFWTVDARYSRSFRLSEGTSLECYIEATNVFNSKHVSFYNDTILSGNNVFTSAVNPLTGELRGPLPNFGSRSADWRDSRQVQIGFKINF